MVLEVQDWHEKTWDLTMYCDSSFADNKDDKYKSTAGYVTYLNGSVVAWKSKKLKWICTSSAEAEYLACYYAARDAIKLAFNLEEVYKQSVWPIKIYLDNMAVIQVIHKSTNTDLTKHMSLKFYKLQEWYEMGLIWFGYVPSEHNISDCCTKPLGWNKFIKFREMLLKVRGSVRECVTDESERKEKCVTHLGPRNLDDARAVAEESVQDGV